MPKTITVKGTGKATAAPDLVVLSMSLESRNLDYERAMDAAAEQIEDLNSALELAGFDRKSVKTGSFSVRTEYGYRNTPDGNGEQIFAGYVVTHNVKVEFDLDPGRLSGALSAIGACTAHPQLSVAFTVKDAETVSGELLRAATLNAKRKAEVLCDASGRKLGDLLSIEYSWNDMSLFSPTRYEMADECMGAPMMAKRAGIAIQPDDIRVSDAATFVWEIR